MDKHCGQSSMGRLVVNDKIGLDGSAPDAATIPIALPRPPARDAASYKKIAAWRRLRSQAADRPAIKLSAIALLDAAAAMRLLASNTAMV